MKKTTPALLITTVVSLFLVNQVSAATSTITAIPPRLQLDAAPGETIRSTLKVRNDSETQQNYSIFIDDFIVDSQTNTPIPISENITSRWSLRKWVTAPDMIPVDAGQTQNIEVTIRVPSTALPGGHYAMITYMPNADIKPGELKKTATIIGQRVGTLLYVNIKGNITEKANLLEFIAPKHSEKGPVEFSGKLENLSDTHIQPQGFIRITDMFNKEVAKLPLDLGNIFPENIKSFQTKWDQKWGYGRYAAELNLVYGSDNKVLSGLVYFWLFPITAVIYSLIAIISILVVIVLLSKRNKKHQEELEKEVRELQKEIESLEKK